MGFFSKLFFFSSLPLVGLGPCAASTRPLYVLHYLVVKPAIQLTRVVLNVLVQGSLYISSLNLKITHLLREVVDVVVDLAEASFP